MQEIENKRLEITTVIRAVNPNPITCFQETPRKTGNEKPIARIEAFELFNLFTADIIRTKEVFTR